MTCAWTPDEATLSDTFKALDEDVQNQCLILATSSLQTLTLNRVGTCPITVRPCLHRISRDEATCGCTWWPWVDESGQWRNNCAHRTECSPDPMSEVDLAGPVGYVASIRINGVEQELDTGNWRIDDGHYLVWQGDGPTPLPGVQDLNKPDTQPGTWSITYSRSYPVSYEARIAVALLAMEFAAALKPKGKCSLPRGVTSVVRNGVTFQIEAGLFPNGLTQIDAVDQFILKWVPAGTPNQSARVYSPRDFRRRTRVSAPLPRVSGNSGPSPTPGNPFDPDLAFSEFETAFNNADGE